MNKWSKSSERNEDHRFVRAYLLSQSHQQLGEEELQTNTEMIITVPFFHVLQNKNTQR